VDEPGAVVGAHEVGRQHGVPLGPELLRLDEVERRLVAGADDVAPEEALRDPRVLAEHGGQARLRQHEAVLGAHVGEVGRDGERGVREHRPRRGRPRQQAVAGAQRPHGLGDRERHVDRRVLDVLVALGDLVGRECGPAAHAVGHDLVALEQQLLVPHRLQRPPHRLDVAGVERAVGVLEVDPVADPLGQRGPVLEELEDRLAALLVELGDAVALDVVLGGEAELLLDRDLDGQPVAVPAALALHEAAAHRLVAREDVLEHARHHVVGAGAPVGGRRALVEDPRLSTLAAAHRLAEDVALAPALEHLLLQGGEVRGLGEWAVGRHGTEDCRSPNI
jgi:hypothetical protein